MPTPLTRQRKSTPRQAIRSFGTAYSAILVRTIQNRKSYFSRAVSFNGAYRSVVYLTALRIAAMCLPGAVPCAATIRMGRCGGAIALSKIGDHKL